MKILFPNEHGAWGMFFNAFLLGWLAAPELSWKPLLLLPAALAAFLARYPAGLYFKKRRVTRALQIPLVQEKKWFGLYAGLTVLFAFPLFYPLGWWWILPFGIGATAALAIHLRSVIQRRERSFFSEATAMIGVSFLVPAASHAAGLQWRPTSGILWLLFILYYLQRIESIRGRVAAKREIPVDFRQVGRCELWYATVFLLLVIAGARIFYF